MDENTCCFLGERKISPKKVESVIKRLNAAIEDVIEKGVINFMSGGALGFDMIAASLIIAKREMGYPIKLIMALPCLGQDKHWSAAQEMQYKRIIAEANDVLYVSSEYSNDCMKKRNQFMVDHSKFCICYIMQNKGIINQALKYAKKVGLTVSYTTR